jgi:regulation of enolase protein 1 (concanavalin A-like superfamily)
LRATRRRFLGGTAGLALAARIGAQAPSQTPTHTAELKKRTGGDLLSRMSWMNAPAHEHFAEGVLSVRSRGKTDFWRKTFFGYVTDNGHFMHLPVSGDFTFQARVNGNYTALYDQAGLMVRLDEKHWMKCGTELVENRRWASVVFTHDFSDWSTMEDLSQHSPVYWRVARKKDSIEAQCSIDGARFLTIRQGYFPASVKVMVGVMCCSPEGQGFDATFDQLMLESS